MAKTPERISLITVDMDGTLLDEQKRLSRRCREAILAAQRKGVAFSICTGRFPENAAIVLKDHGIDCPVIGLNGGMTTDAPFGKVISSHPMDRASAKEVFAMLERLGAAYFMFGRGSVATRVDGDRHHSQAHFGDRLALEAGVQYRFGYEACVEALGRDLYKFFVYPRKDREELRAVRAALGAIPSVALTQSGETNIEVIPPHVDKGTGLSELAAFLGIPLERTMAIGDEENDLPMIRAAGIGIAMGNASAAVREGSDFVTLSNTEDGVAAAIEKFALGS